MAPMMTTLLLLQLILKSQAWPLDGGSPAKSDLTNIEISAAKTATNDDQLFTQFPPIASLLIRESGTARSSANVMLQSLPNNEPDKTARTADDFTVPEGGWSIDAIKALFTFVDATNGFAYVENAQVKQWKISIYSNENNEPSKVAVQTRNVQTSDVERSVTDMAVGLEIVEISLDSPLRLDEGTYYISVVAVTDWPVAAFQAIGVCETNDCGADYYVSDDQILAVPLNPKPECTIPEWGLGSFCDTAPEDSQLIFGLYGDSLSDEAGSDSDSGSSSDENENGLLMAMGNNLEGSTRMGASDQSQSGQPVQMEVSMSNEGFAVLFAANVAVLGLAWLCAYMLRKQRNSEGHKVADEEVSVSSITIDKL